MAKPNKRIPAKLKHDAIVEALFEIRFEMATIPEVFFGRLTEHAAWKNFQQSRMAAYQIPPMMRDADSNLRYAPVLELHDSEKKRAVRFGAKVLSYHRFAPYVGWKSFKPELVEVVHGLFANAEDLTIRRLGLRYINAIRPELHVLRSISELDLKIAIENEDVSSVNVNFRIDLSDEMECGVRVATQEFLRGAVPQNTPFIVDVDVFTRQKFKTQDAQEVERWIELAHTKEKEQFFRLLTQNTIDLLEEK